MPPRIGLAEAIRYALARWPALCRFIEDGRIELDNNPVERARHVSCSSYLAAVSENFTIARIAHPLRCPKPR